MITICAIMRNELRYLLEWIAYHRAIGIKRFVIYDNESDDGTSELLQRLDAISVVTRVPWITPDDQSPQLTAYNDFLRHDASDGFAAFIDSDEFLSLPEGFGTVPEYFERRGLCDLGIGAVAVNQRVFGSAGEEAYRPEPVMRRFTKTAEDGYDENRWFKTICRPAYAARFHHSHSPTLKKGTFVTAARDELRDADARTGRTPEVGSGLRVNHYIIKSLGEFREKQARGGVAAPTLQGRMDRYKDDAFFHGRDAWLNKQTWRFPEGVLARAEAAERELEGAVSRRGAAA